MRKIIALLLVFALCMTTGAFEMLAQDCAAAADDAGGFQILKKYSQIMFQILSN